MKFKKGEKIKCISNKQTLTDWECPTLPDVGREYTVQNCGKEPAYAGPRRDTNIEVVYVEEVTSWFPVEDFELADDPIGDYDRAMRIV